jgi:hypothetical protein
MGLRSCALAVSLAAGLLLPAGACARTWAAPSPLGPGESTYLVQSLPLGGGLISVYQRIGPAGSEIVARVADAAGGFGDAQVIGPARAFYPALAADAAGEAAAAWYEESDNSIRVSLRAPGAAFDDPTILASDSAGYSQQAPKLAASPVGWMAVLYLDDVGDGQRAYVSVRPPGGSFGAGEPVAPGVGAEAQVPRSVAVDDAGEVVAGYLQGGVAHVAVRSTGLLGTWGAPQSLGRPNLGSSWDLPEVGIDAAGGAVAIWEEDGGQNRTAPLEASFRAPGGSFGAPQDLGIDSWDGEAPALGVSGLGEVILVARPTIQETGGLGLDPLVVLSGSTVLGRFGPFRPLAQTWEDSYPRLAMNARGDAVLTTTTCCPTRLVARRRAPLAGFVAEQDVVPPLPMVNGPQRLIRDVGLDQLGNAAVTWNDSTDGSPLLVSADGPVLAAVADVTLPLPVVLAELVPAPPVVAVPDPPAPPPPWSPPFPFPLPFPFPFPFPYPTPPPPPGAFPTGAAPSVPAPSAANRAALPADGRFAVALRRLPSRTGPAKIVVSVRCAAACRAAVRGVLVTSSRRRLTLPQLALATDRPGAVTASLPLTPAARASLARPRGRSRLRVTAVAGDRAGRAQTATAELALPGPAHAARRPSR